MIRALIQIQVIVIILTFVVGCHSTSLLNNKKLTVVSFNKANYLCDKNDLIQIEFYGLSDNSMEFVKVTLPTGERLTLPRTVSASGALYDASSGVQLFLKGKMTRLDVQETADKWSKLYANCSQVE